ncbi:MAG: ankyrin repeat domain-containing protein [Limisphaerales bacterium]
MHAVYLNEAEIAEILLNAGADVHGTNKDESTALIHSSMVGNYEITELLIKAGSDVNWASLSGRTALHWAKTVDIARLLIEHGADGGSSIKLGKPKTLPGHSI